jgi:hypothetical protein
MATTRGEKPIISWGHFTRELREARDPSHGISIISRAIKNSMFRNSLGEGPRQEFDCTVKWVGSLKTKIMRLFRVDKH